MATNGGPGIALGRTPFQRTIPGLLVLSLIFSLIPAAALTFSASPADAAAPIPTALAGRGANDAEFGNFPSWYQDDDGTRLVPCTEDEIACHYDGPPNPELPESFPTNFPDVFNYYAVEAANLQLTNAPATLRAQLISFGVSGGFANETHTPVDGDQAVSNGAEFRVRGLPAGNYTVTHPWGEFTATSDGDQLREGIGYECEAGPCDHDAALAGAVTRFLMPVGGAGPEGLLSDGETPTQITGSPYGTNYVKITGPDGFELFTDQFIVHGQLFQPDGASAPTAAPTGVTATAGEGEATVNWAGVPIANDGDAPITGYRITSSPAGVDTVVKASERSFTATGLTNGTDYTLSVAAVNAAGDGAATASNVVRPVTVPTAPQNVTATEGNGVANVSWTAPASDGGQAITGYVVRASNGETKNVDASTTSIEFPTVNGRSYTYTVRAINGVRDGSDFSAPSGQVIAGAPSNVSGLTSTGGSREVTLSWTNAPQADLAGVEVRMAAGTTAPTRETGVEVFRGTGTSTVVEGLKDGASYSFTVFSYDQTGNVSNGVSRTGKTTSPFSDIAGTTHESAILLLSSADITGGFSNGTFDPKGDVKRGQMASFLVKALKLPPSSGSSFSDIRGTTHEAAIRALAAAGITGGFSDGTFKPNAPVTRGQMATFLVNALDLPASNRGGFNDIRGHAHEKSIRALAAAGITGGFSDGRFRPDANVERGQMATFLVKALPELSQ